MHTVPGLDGRLKKIPKDRVAAVSLITPPYPPPGLAFVGVVGGFVAVIGRIAQANNDGNGALDLEGPSVLFCNRS
jgi:hypothetical protein